MIVVKIYGDKCGDNDVGDIVMLVSCSLRRFVDVGDSISMMVTSFECWYVSVVLPDANVNR